MQRRQPARALGVTALAMLALGFPLALMQSDAHHQPFAGYGALAWAVFAVMGVRTLLCLRQGGDSVARIAQFLWWLLWPSLLRCWPCGAVARPVWHRAGPRCW